MLKDAEATVTASENVVGREAHDSFNRKVGDIDDLVLDVGASSSAAARTGRLAMRHPIGPRRTISSSVDRPST